ncbi:MAG: sulfatase-like hydrolase/transferase [Thaumarchaeota archaeon]|nr:sulfatase-like hydrolase/transferase [Nitrososphaerota archaeon]
MSKKNVVIIMIDGGRLDRAISSPIFGNLKNQSVFFSQSVTYGPHTIAAMHAVFSGSYGTRTGTNSYWSTFKFKKDKFKTLTEYLKDHNYYTHADVINELVVPKQGFDNYVVHDESKDDLTARHKELLRDAKSKSDGGQNFFLYLHYSNIHTGIMNQVLKVYDNFSKEFFDNKSENEKRYDVLFHAAETYFEQIFEEIKKLRLDKSSVILVMSDHGISVGEKFGERAYGAFCYDYTLRTFTYFVAEDFAPKEITQQIRTIDFMPTILDYLEIPLDSRYEKLDGVSLLPLIRGEQMQENTAYSETGNPLSSKEPPREPNTKSIRNSKWKLIYNQHNETKELYDLEHDPKEERNLYGAGLEIEKILWTELQRIQSS